MTRPAPRASLPCPSCHASADVKIVEDRWQTHESLACDRCSLTQEADGERVTDAAEEEARSRTAAGTTAPLAVGSKLMVDALALRECGAEVALREVPRAPLSTV